MIQLRPWEDMAAAAVFRALDPSDLLEAELVRGAAVGHLALWADWRSIEPLRLASFVALTAGGNPFAVFGLVHTGQAGVASAALLARDHRVFRRPLAQLAVILRDAFPGHCRERGVHRVEARSWSAHPTAPRLLAALGFRAEARMPGFGPDGATEFTQWAWTARSQGSTPCAP